MMSVDYSVIKPLFLFLYSVFGGTCLCLASSNGRALLTGVLPSFRNEPLGLYLASFPAVLLFVTFVLQGSLLLVSAVVIAAIVFALQTRAGTAPKCMVAGLSAAIVALSLVWWQMDVTTVEPFSLAAFALSLAVFTYGLSDRGGRPSRSMAAISIVFGVAGLFLLIDLGSYRIGALGLWMLAHHWGAFIGPVVQAKSGLVPFYDMPLQYGLGPTLSIAASCQGSDCWLGAQTVFTGMTIASGLVVLMMALTVRVPRGWMWSTTVAALVFAAIFLWPGFPSDGNILIATPSVGAIRFLPVTLVAFLFFFEKPRAALAMMIPAVLWSPESAAMSAVVFTLCGTARFGFIRAGFLTAGLLAGSYGGLFLLHRLVYGVWIDPAALVEYVLHVPGPLPIDPFSDIWVLVMVLGLGGWLMVQPAKNPSDRARDLAATALLFAASSYCLGRSHPNNICNLAPFLVLVAVRVLDRSGPDHDIVRRATAFGLAVSVASLAFSPWRSVPFDPHPLPDIHAVVARFAALQPDVERIRAGLVNPDGLGIADFGPTYARNPSESIVWTPMDPSSLWSYVPSARRRLYIERSVRRLRRAGWAIAADNQSFLVDDLTSAYIATNEARFDGAPTTPGGPAVHYRVACFNPKPQFASPLVGPACPSAAVR